MAKTLSPLLTAHSPTSSFGHRVATSLARTALYGLTLNRCVGLKILGGMILSRLRGDFSVFGRPLGVRCLSIISGVVEALE